MEFERACRLLGVTPQDTPEDIKRKYRRLIAEVHPDAEKYLPKADKADVAGINAAYALLIKKGEYQKRRKETPPDRQENRKKSLWDAPVNPAAYAEREIYQYAEGAAGEVMGIYTAAAGKYYWNHETEDFRLFLRSVVSVASRLLDQQEELCGYPFQEAAKFHAQKELTYLLAGQFTDLESGLQAFARAVKKDSDGNVIYYLPAMLELRAPSGIRTLNAGERLFPLQMKNHRLYLGPRGGTAAGYLSFPDDRAYYVLIPMFENREVQVKIEIAEAVGSASAGFVKLHLWVRRVPRAGGVQEDVNARIRRILTELADKRK